jgi:hypothetical protein
LSPRKAINCHQPRWALNLVSCQTAGKISVGVSREGRTPEIHCVEKDTERQLAKAVQLAPLAVTPWRSQHVRSIPGLPGNAAAEEHRPCRVDRKPSTEMLVPRQAQ